MQWLDLQEYELVLLKAACNTEFIWKKTKEE